MSKLERVAGGQRKQGHGKDAAYADLHGVLGFTWRPMGLSTYL